ncbi:hypothetical protein CVT24_012285 [Panaeolus cyanescens]|uniref:Prenylcysteine lyase domain-containing protein n=1 Tax=Panaeolus cyanescens TaxID=181874 RepID=A0A409WK30_9AGAR|nr:hypothetical protein CVT24_012285 [Panaeolus cyanescens]
MIIFRCILQTLSVAFLAVIWFAEWRLLTRDLFAIPDHQPVVEHRSAPPFKVAIIGAGAGGSSTAFWLSQAVKRSNHTTAIDIDIYDKLSYIGGRSLVVSLPDVAPYPYHVPVELGAHRFGLHERHLMRAAHEFALPLHRITPLDSNFIWNGRELFALPLSMWNTLRLAYRYELSPSVIQSLIQRATRIASSMCNIYKQNSVIWANTADILHRLNLTELVTSTTSDYLVRAGISTTFVKDFFQYGTANDHATHALQTFFALRSAGAEYRVIGGTNRIFEEFAIRSGASLFLNTEVKSIEYAPDTNNWKVNVSNGTKKYDAVIVAAPLYQTNITIPKHLSCQIPSIPHHEEHITILATRSSSINHQFLNLSSGVGDIQYLAFFPVGEAWSFPFSELSYVREASPGIWIVKITSRSHIATRWLSEAFNGKIDWVHRHTWTVPMMAPPTHLPHFKLAEGFYYLSGFESVISSMEGQVVAAQNVVNILWGDMFNQNVCGGDRKTGAHNINNDDIHPQVSTTGGSPGQVPAPVKQPNNGNAAICERQDCLKAVASTTTPSTTQLAANMSLAEQILSINGHLNNTGLLLECVAKQLVRTAEVLAKLQYLKEDNSSAFPKDPIYEFFETTGQTACGI